MVVNTTPPEGRVSTFCRSSRLAGLLRGLAEQVAAHRKRAEQLVVEVVAVGDDHNGRVLHRRVGDDLPGVEGHQQTLAGALRVPDDADALVALLLRCNRRQSVLRRILTHAQSKSGECAQGGRDRTSNGVELVITGHDLDDARARISKHGEVPDQGQESVLLEHAFDDGPEFRRTLRGDGSAVHGAPGHEALDIGRQRTQARLNPVRGHERGVGAEQGRYPVLVGLKLVERPFEGGVFVARVLQLDHGQGQAVDEQHHIGPAVVLSLNHRELVHRQPVVGIGVGEIDQPGSITADAPILPGNLDGHALDEVTVQAAVLLDERGGFRLPHLAQHLVQRFGGKVRVEACECLAEPTGQQYLIVAATLRRRTLRADVRSVRHGIAEPGEPFEGSPFNFGFGESGHSAGTNSRFIMRRKAAFSAGPRRTPGAGATCRHS